LALNTMYGALDVCVHRGMPQEWNEQSILTICYDFICYLPYI